MMPASASQQQEELLRLFFSSSSTTSATARPVPIISPYPASSYTRFVQPFPFPASAALTEQKEQTVSFLAPAPSSASASASASALFSTRPVVSPHVIKQRQEKERRQRRRQTAPQQAGGRDWNRPLQRSLHLPILKDILAPQQQCVQQQEGTAAPPAAVSAAVPSSSLSASGALPPLSSTLSRVYLQSAAYEHSLRLRTSDDAIAFFSRMGSSSPVKFVYANRATAASAASAFAAYRPYDLQVVDRKHINPSEYFTISRHGIVAITQPAAGSSHGLSSACETESTSLSEWVHQSAMFGLLRSIRFFRLFLVSKLFRLWKANVRFRVYEQQRRRIANSLFLARPSFCSALLEVGELMGDIRQVALGSVRHGVVYSSDSFGKEQGEVRSLAVKRVETCVERVEDVLEAVCKGVKDRARLYDHRIANEELSNSRCAQHLLGDAGSGLGGGSGGKVKSMVQQKQEKRVRLQQLHHANREADMLGEFIRLVDYIELETLCSRCIDNTADFLSLLLHSVKPLFITAVSFAPSPAEPSQSLLFTPTSADIVALLTSVSSSTIAAVDGLSRIISHRKFLPLLRDGAAAAADVLRVSGIVHDDRCYSVMMREMEQRVDAGFRGVNDSVRFLEKHRVVWEYGERIRAQQQSGGALQDDDIEPSTAVSSLPSPSAASPSAVLTASAAPSPSPIAALTHTLTGLTRWSTSLQHIRDLYSSGLIQADCRSLKLTLLPITEAAIGRKRRRMVELFVEGVERVMAEYAVMQSQLRDEPVMLSQYVDYVRLVAEVKAREQAVRSGLLKELAQLQRLMLDDDMYNSNWVAASEQVRYDEMLETAAAFSSASLPAAERKIEGKWEEMKGKVMQEIKRLEQSIEQLARSMDDNVLYTDYSSWGGISSAGASGLKDVLQALEADGRRWRELQKKTEEMQRQQTVLEETSHVFKGLQALQDKADRRRAFFTAVESFKERERRFWTGELDKADCAAVTAELAAMDAAVAVYAAAVRPERSGAGAGSTRESERSVDAVKRELEMLKSFRSELGFYHHFLPVVKELQQLLAALGPEQYKQSFAGFGHLKRMKDLKKVDWNQYKTTIAVKKEEIRAEAAAAAAAAPAAAVGTGAE